MSQRKTTVAVGIPASDHSTARQSFVRTPACAGPPESSGSFSLRAS